MKKQTKNSAFVLKNLPLFKKGFRLMVTVLVLLTTTAFNSTADYWGEWSLWKTSDCYSGIEYRWRERETNVKNKIQVQMEIKNTYTKGIKVTHIISHNPSETVIYRISLKSGEVHVSEKYVDVDKRYYLVLDRLRFAGEAFGDPIHKCDK